MLVETWFLTCHQQDRGDIKSSQEQIKLEVVAPDYSPVTKLRSIAVGLMAAYTGLYKNKWQLVPYKNKA